MNIAIDVSPLKTDHHIRGTGSYTKLLIEALQKHEARYSYYFFTRGQKLPKNIDVVHYPYFDPFFLTLPLNKPKPVVVTVHDLIPMAYPTHFPRGVRGEIKWQIQRWSLQRSKRVITDSQASKTDVVRYASIPSEKIRIIYLAPADIFRPIKDVKMLARVSREYHLPKRFVLYVGDVNWNKNIPGLLRAIAELGLPGAHALPLVLVGKAFMNENLEEVKNIRKLINDLDIANQIFMPGFVPDEDLVAIYNLAAVYVQPSFAEGFGLPVLEAMACGCPVVSSKTSSLTEIAGPSLLVDVENPNGIASGIIKALQIKREKWTQEAAGWVKKFNWRKTAVQTIAVYESALA